MLSSLLASQVYLFFMVFCRLGSAVMLLPGIGEAYVTGRARLGLALLFSLVLLPGVAPSIPPMPSSPYALFALMIREIIVGIFLGTLVNILTSAMHTAGMIMSYQAGLSMATMFDTSQATQGTALGNFFGLASLTLIFALDLHHLMLDGIAQSYTVFVPGQALPLGDFAEAVSVVVGKTFTIAMKLASPLIVVGLLLGLAAGVLARLMPIIPIFFIIMSPQILLGFFIVMTTLSGVLMWYMQFLDESLKSIF